MTAFQRKTFSVGAPGSSEYRDAWEKTFRGENAPPPPDGDGILPPLEDGTGGAHGVTVKAVAVTMEIGDILKSLPREATRDVQALFEATELVLSVEHPTARAIAGELRKFAFELAAAVKNGGAR